MANQRFQINDRVLRKPKTGISRTACLGNLANGKSPYYGTRYGSVQKVKTKVYKNGVKHYEYEILWDGKTSLSIHASNVLEHIPPESPHFDPPSK